MALLNLMVQWVMTADSPNPQAPAGTAVLVTSADRPLLVNPLQHLRGQPHLSAARGLVRVRQRLYVLADDDLQLGMFEDVAATDPVQADGTLLRLLEDDLRVNGRKRKQPAPDLETLAQLPSLPGCPAGALLALSSGARPGRETAVLVALDVQGLPNGRMAQVDLTELYAPLHKRFVDLNIEAALVVSGELLLLQRGSKGNKLRSACIRYDWNLMAPWLAGRLPTPPPVKSVQVLALGSVNGASLGFTDGVALHGGAWAFSAVAHTAINDGRTCAGAVIGIVGSHGALQSLHALEGAPKVEGLTATAEGSDWVFTLVADPEDPELPAKLLHVRLPQALA